MLQKSRGRIPCKTFRFYRKKSGCNVTALTGFVGLRQPTVSYHLKEMTESGLLIKTERGKEVLFEVNKECPRDGERCLLVS